MRRPPRLTIPCDPRAEAACEQPKVAKRIKQEPGLVKVEALPVPRAAARAAAPRPAAAAPKQPVKLEKQPMPVAEPAEDANEVAEEDEENLHPVPSKVSAPVALSTCQLLRALAAQPSCCMAAGSVHLCEAMQIYVSIQQAIADWK